VLRTSGPIWIIEPVSRALMLTSEK
jgi:hypothetical protein